MSPASPESQIFSIGQKVWHTDLGEGVILLVANDYANVFFREFGERLLQTVSLRPSLDVFEQIIQESQSPKTQEQLSALALRVWLAIEAEELPLMENSATLTASKVDLLPHQIVLVHRVASACPRRFLIADEVGLGKTIEIALILRELASRDELGRALIIVPAGLVENWRHELNDVFNLDFEVFGAEGDVTDRKTNAFAKHDRIIASIDTLKRPARIKRLLTAPPWDLVVFDEAHHLNACRTGKKVAKTENYKLADAIRNHCRDMLFLSATPHQGDHFRFWSLIRLLDPALFLNETDMVNNRHRLNAVVIRRTKADACARDGSTLFARRMVNTMAFNLFDAEKKFYDALLDYLRDGYDMAAKGGGRSRALGFVMTVFQKIAASSFAAIRSTLIRRLLMLTIHEGLERDELLDVDGRDRLFSEARKIIHAIYKVDHTPVGYAQVEQIFADAKYQLVKKRNEAMAYAESAESGDDFEQTANAGEDSAGALVTVALPEERNRIRNLLDFFPNGQEAKTVMLIRAMKEIWSQNSEEKIVIFATYLGTVEAIKNQVEIAFPDIGVEVLKGGDHGSKTAAQKRFKNKNGPKVMVCTAAGREGINLQFAHILFNYDLHWNPMDVEQRIGRIHRYGQASTSQIYNLVSADTIEGKIYLLLEEKLQHIAKALGKTDTHGNITEDMRSQILGQLGESINFSKIYQYGINDPALKRTSQELEVALENACRVRDVVLELFQDLERFNIDDYNNVENTEIGMKRLAEFMSGATISLGESFKPVGKTNWVYKSSDNKIEFTLDRDVALTNENLQLLGLDHPAVQKIINYLSDFKANSRYIAGKLTDTASSGLLTVWKVSVHSEDGTSRHNIVKIGIDRNGFRCPSIEKVQDNIKNIQLDIKLLDYWRNILFKFRNKFSGLLQRQLIYSGIIGENSSYSSKLIAVIGIN